MVLIITVTMYSQVVRKDCNDKGAILGAHLQVEFDSEASRISLELPSNGVTLKGWKLLPLFNPEVG